LRALEQMGLVRRESARSTRLATDTHGARTEILSLVCTTEPLAAGIESLRLATLVADQQGWGARIHRLGFAESLPLLRSLKVGNPHIIDAERKDRDAPLTPAIHVIPTARILRESTAPQGRLDRSGDRGCPHGGAHCDGIGMDPLALAGGGDRVAQGLRIGGMNHHDGTATESTAR
jgi:hypothetical protein